jgi:hypothetical protein
VLHNKNEREKLFFFLIHRRCRHVLVCEECLHAAGRYLDRTTKQLLLLLLLHHVLVFKKSRSSSDE